MLVIIDYKTGQAYYSVADSVDVDLTIVTIRAGGKVTRKIIDQDQHTVHLLTDQGKLMVSHGYDAAQGRK